MATSFLPEGDDAGGIVAEINITPLTDVFLVLLVIFMVTSSVIAHTGKKVDLPEAVEAARRLRNRSPSPSPPTTWCR